jgi:hypothetical protein
MLPAFLYAFLCESYENLYFVQGRNDYSQAYLQFSQAFLGIPRYTIVVASLLLNNDSEIQQIKEEWMLNWIENKGLSRTTFYLYLYLSYLRSETANYPAFRFNSKHFSINEYASNLPKKLLTATRNK